MLDRLSAVMDRATFSCARRLDDIGEVPACLF